MIASEVQAAFERLSGCRQLVEQTRQAVYEGDPSAVPDVVQ